MFVYKIAEYSKQEEKVNKLLKVGDPIGAFGMEFEVVSNSGYEMVARADNEFTSIILALYSLNSGTPRMVRVITNKATGSSDVLTQGTLDDLIIPFSTKFIDWELTENGLGYTAFDYPDVATWREVVMGDIIVAHDSDGTSYDAKVAGVTESLLYVNVADIRMVYSSEYPDLESSTVVKELWSVSVRAEDDKPVTLTLDTEVRVEYIPD